MSVMNIYIASDHAGVELKEKIVSLINSLGHKAIDLGAKGKERVDYPNYALSLCKEVLNSNDKGILICGSGIGMSITANKVKGIRAALCRDENESSLSRKHNDSNVLCLGARTTEEGIALKIVKTWCETPFEGGRHERRVDKIALSC